MAISGSGNLKDVKEQFNEQNGNAMPITTTKILIELATPAACRIITPEGMAGTGALYSVKTKAELISVLTTSKHVLSKQQHLAVTPNCNSHKSNLCNQSFFRKSGLHSFGRALYLTQSLSNLNPKPTIILKNREPNLCKLLTGQLKSIARVNLWNPIQLMKF